MITHLTMYKPTGQFLLSCPTALLHSPAVSEAAEWASWLSRQCVNPFDLPVFLRRACSAYLGAFEKGREDYWESKRATKDSVKVDN